MIQYEALADSIRALEPSAGSTRLICIDGRAGSGKTTCALALQELLPQSSIIHMDDLYHGWTEDLDDSLATRILEQIISPMLVGESSKYQRFNWFLNDFDDWVEISPSAIVILEGVASSHPLIRQHASLSVWIEIDPELGAQRVLARDGEISENHIENW
ncbi:MAG: hypothetical protein RIS75_951, partial [Actinomycetota bacterium]